MGGLERLRFNVADGPPVFDDLRRRVFRGADAAAGGFASDEDAARHYLDKLLRGDRRPTMRGLAGDDAGPAAPGMALAGDAALPQTNTKLFRFAQQHADIPIFGARAHVEIDDQQGLVSADVTAGVPDVGSAPSIDGNVAVAAVAAFVEARLTADDVAEPGLVYFHDDEADKWHLAWLVSGVPALPAEAKADDSRRAGHGYGTAFRARHERADYLVDADDGAILMYYGTAPTIVIPVLCTGTDEDGNAVEFNGAQEADGFGLHDPLRHVRTFDFASADIDETKPPDTILINAAATFGDEHRAAVTAHNHGAIVQDFYKRVLQRDGIDDKGMELLSVVNATCAQETSPPEWLNACWWEGRMWYGQAKDASGRLVSWSRYLDIIAHELTHGVIENTAGLLYENQSGALNESFADIFGIIIANSYRAKKFADVTTWEFRVGVGLGDNGGPLRDMADPTKTGDPAHMDHAYKGRQDFGGVHTNSNIHNKAVHGVLTAVDQSGQPVMTVNEATTLLYLTLSHLKPRSNFHDARDTMIEVAKVYFMGTPDKAKAVEGVIDEAYDQVGIS